MRANLNRALAFSGLAVNAAGELISVDHAKTLSEAEQRADELRAEYGIDVEVLPADLADRTQVLEVAKRVEDPNRPIDLLVNNAGFGLHSTLLDPHDIDLHAKALDVMCLAVLILGGAAGRAMSKRGEGRIINVSSTAGTIYTGNYSAVKAWCTTYSNGLGLELRDKGVTVTALCPGWVRTEFHQRAGIKASSLPGIVWISPETLVKGALADAEKGRYVSVPTVRWKIAYFLSVHAPRGLIRAFSRALSASRKKK